MKTKKAVVLIPIYKKELTAFEKISFQQCIKILGKFDIAFIAAESLKLDCYKNFWNKHSKKNFKAIRFADRFFIDVGAYSRLMLSTKFYESFLDFEYLLIYQLDAFVFRNDLEYWCNQGYDYIGAAWLANHGKGIIGVGNGGFSLRNIQKHLRVLRSFSYIKKPHELLTEFLQQKKEQQKLPSVKELLKNLSFRNNFHHWCNDFQRNEDVFWGYFASKNFSWFNVPSVEKAGQFAMEINPRISYELQAKQLPFGVHAWWTYDLEFWKPFIEKEGYTLQESNEFALNAKLSCH